MGKWENKKLSKLSTYANTNAKEKAKNKNLQEQKKVATSIGAILTEKMRCCRGLYIGQDYGICGLPISKIEHSAPVMHRRILNECFEARGTAPAPTVDLHVVIEAVKDETSAGADDPPLERCFEGTRGG
jgi:hypothetical protein